VRLDDGEVKSELRWRLFSPESHHKEDPSNRRGWGLFFSSGSSPRIGEPRVRIEPFAQPCRPLGMYREEIAAATVLLCLLAVVAGCEHIIELCGN
jgi:hypothetical protein